MLSSTFNNYLWQRLIDDGIELPEINDVFFTNLRPTELRMHFIDIIALVNFTSAMISINCILSSVGCAVCGKTSKYSKYFDEFATAFKIKYYLPWMSNTSQVICALKSEMTTVTKNDNARLLKFKMILFLVTVVISFFNAHITCEVLDIQGR